MARTKAADYDTKKAVILSAAARLFAEDGYYQSSMASLATECGMSKALLYHYYQSKEALLFDVIGEHLKELCEAMEDVDDPDADPETRLYELVKTLLEKYRNADNQHRVQVNAMKLLPEEHQQKLKEMERRLVIVFGEAVNGVNPKLADKPGLLKVVTMSLFGMLNWHYMWFREEGPISRDDYADLATQMIIAGARKIA